jgi:hypothetical protein
LDLLTIDEFDKIVLPTLLGCILGFRFGIKSLFKLPLKLTAFGALFIAEAMGLQKVEVVISTFCAGLYKVSFDLERTLLKMLVTLFNMV